MSDYSELKRLAAAATPGPYRQCGADKESKSCTCGQVWSTATDELVAFVHDGDEMAGAPAAGQSANAQFFAAANPAAVLALIAENEALRLALESCADELEGQVIQCYHGIPVEDMHPVTRRAYDRDMHGVVEARTAMKKAVKDD